MKIEAAVESEAPDHMIGPNEQTSLVPFEGLLGVNKHRAKVVLEGDENKEAIESQISETFQFTKGVFGKRLGRGKRSTL